MSRWVAEPKKLGGGRWIEVHEIQYSVPQAEAKQEEEEESTKTKETKVACWEVVRRAGSILGGRGDHFDAAEVAITIKPHPDSFKSPSEEPAAAPPLYLCLVSQYRAPLDRRCLEFCAGLVDPGEQVETSALRELHEETGIKDGLLGAKVSVVSVSPPVSYEPGMTNSCCSLVEVLVELPKELRAEEYVKKIHEHASLEELEQSMQLHIVPYGARMFADLQALGCRIDCKVYSYVLGLCRGLSLQQVQQQQHKK